MKQYERFAECMRRILDEQGVSVTELAKAVGFKSRNSLFRILNDQTSSEVEASFFHALKEKKCLELSLEAWAKLEQALELSRVGYGDYTSNLAIRNLLIEPDHGAGDYKCFSQKMTSDDQPIPLDTLLREWTKHKKVELTLCSCCNAGFCRTLANVLLAKENACKWRMTHFFYAGSDEIVKNIMAIQPLLYSDWYKAYMLEPGTCSPEAEALLRVSSVQMHAVDQQGVDHWEQLVLLDNERLMHYKLEDDAAHRLVGRLMEESRPNMRLVKSEFDNLHHDAEDYLLYTENYRLLERNCAILSLKPDVPINFIHPDILLDPVREGLAQAGIAVEDDVMQLVEKLYSIQLARFKNFVDKKKVTHTVFSRAAMERFVRTGKQSDHFYAMRPFTPAERKAILMHLREQAVHNPYFWVYFLKDEAAEHIAEITLYEGRGVLFVQSDTGYNLEGGHSEALINNSDLNNRFKNFFMKDLLVNYVLSYQDTINLLDNMIHLLG